MVVVTLYNINSSRLDVLLGRHACMYECVSTCVLSLFPWQSFTKLFFIFSPLTTPPCITAFRLLRSLFLSFLIDMQDPTSLNCVFHAPWFSALSSSLVFPFLGQLSDVSICRLLLPRQVRVPFSFTHMTVKAYKIAYITCIVHEGIHMQAYIIHCHTLRHCPVLILRESLQIYSPKRNK